MKSANEEFCKSSFDDFLRKTAVAATVAWQDGDEPPDYYLSYIDVRYAVEVTILMEKLAVGMNAMPQMAVIASLWDFVDEVEQTARERNLLHGTYIVRFSKPIEDFRSVKSNLQAALLYYIEGTQDLDKAPSYIAFEQANQSCVIEKLHRQSNQIHKTGPNNAKWEGEAAIEICNLLEERLAEKRHKLRNVAFPKIALLYDSYHFADQKMYKNCLPNLSPLASFHTVFVVQSNSEGFVLHSQNSDWW